MITIEDFAKLEIKVGTILLAVKLEGADKLLVLQIDIGEAEPRQIVSGIALYFPDPAVLVGKQIPIIANLAPRMLRGVESRGMIMAASNEEAFSLLVTEQMLTPGSNVK